MEEKRTDKRIKFLSIKCLPCWKILNKGGFYFLIASLPSTIGIVILLGGGVALPNTRSDLGLPKVESCVWGTRKIESKS